MPLTTPTLSTLKKYGLTIDEWQRMADAQQHACAVCKQEPTKGRLCIDHEHVPKWKKMPPEQRVLFVRGLLCYRCNTTFVGRGITVERSRGVTVFLETYEIRRPVLVIKPKKSRSKQEPKCQPLQTVPLVSTTSPQV